MRLGAGHLRSGSAWAVIVRLTCSLNMFGQPSGAEISRADSELASELRDAWAIAGLGKLDRRLFPLPREHLEQKAAPGPEERDRVAGKLAQEIEVVLIRALDRPSGK